MHRALVAILHITKAMVIAGCQPEDHAQAAMENAFRLE